ncbi:putative non-F420 flavinoid oxidoreductase [Cellulosimicrobium cellulans]|uniref:LLM class F420-dependent oxidoreductase n=1 Tax=Cellulosimicrobium cellulans TaxID=1710 RepID=A0A1Y0HV03_CELCE|nr:TIGR03885 family FMN-dependent LLM class oxidoreductase [Cellulosimicrobium cellulans]ARU51135.1 LLM class F420-dependent oxidoreductase [Cellulosimicrobium cellulans]MBM7821611.1 putative non-F420 flavinoid oxidoreductase [Cellulosimicrobium cellulans]
MVSLGFHASHEQIAPGPLLGAARRAQEVGFDAAMCSDHLAPWSVRQGESGHSWSWLGAALASTDLPFGVVTAPGQRYHPAVVAQAIATLGQMFPGRFWAALGSGEAMNEHVTGDPWPPKSDRDDRLRECVDVIRALLAGEEVTHRGHVTVDRARVWSLPDVVPRLVGPAVTPATARRHADWADGLVTVNQPVESLRRVVGAYGDAGGRGPLALQVHVAWGDDDAAAFAVAHDQWRSNLLPPSVSWHLETPEQFDAVADLVRPEEVRGTVLVEHDAERFADRVAELAACGFDEVYLHHVGQQQDAFLDAAGGTLLPLLRSATATTEGGAA